MAVPSSGPPSPQAAADLMRERLRGNSQPGARADDATLALAIEGGGMRGVVAAGMLLALEQLGLRDTIDLIVATSAGALAAAFFLDGRTIEGSVLFYTELHTEPFLDRSRMLKMEAAIDLDYLIDQAAPARGLDLAAVADSSIPLYATVSPVEPDNPIRYFPVEGDIARMAAILKATASLPVLAGGAKEVDGEDYVDGGLHEPVPWRTAAALGATHILVLPSRPVLMDEKIESLSLVERLAVVPVVRRIHGDHIGDLLADLPAWSSQQAWNLRAVADGLSCPLSEMAKSRQVRIDIVDIPDSVELPTRLERSRPVLVDALVGGATALVDHLGMGGPDGVAVEQRVVLTHPTARVKDFRSKHLSTLFAEASPRRPN